MREEGNTKKKGRESEQKKERVRVKNRTVITGFDQVINDSRINQKIGAY